LPAIKLALRQNWAGSSERRTRVPFQIGTGQRAGSPARLADGLELESAPIGSLRPAPREQAALMLKAVSFQLVPPLPAFFGQHSAAGYILYRQTNGAARLVRE